MGIKHRTSFPFHEGEKGNLLHRTNERVLIIPLLFIPRMPVYRSVILQILVRRCATTNTNAKK